MNAQVDSVHFWSGGLATPMKSLLATGLLLSCAAASAIAQSAARANVAGTMAANAGNNQTATVGTAVVLSPSIIVKDARGIPLGGVSVTFAVVTGGGRIAGNPSLTSASGIATVGAWTLGTTAGKNQLAAMVAGFTGSPVVFTATGTAAAVSAATSTLTAGSSAMATGATMNLKAIARDAYNNPVPGVRVAFVSTGAGTSFRQPTAPTDADGLAVGSLSASAPGTKTVWAYTAACISTRRRRWWSGPEGLTPIDPRSRRRH